jgi:hypothetical protein
MDNKMKTLLTILGLIVIMTSCEYAYDYSYTVTNKTDSKIKVYVKTFRIDSIFTISKDSTKILFIGDHGIEGSKGPYFDNVTVDLDNFTVTKNDTITSTRDYMKNESWIFNNGDYSTTITNDEF